MPTTAHARQSRSTALRTITSTATLCAALTLGSLTAPAPAQAPPPTPANGPDPAATPAPTPAPTSLTPELIQTRIQETTLAEDLDETIKTKAVELYQQAKTRLETANSQAANANTFQLSLDSTPQEIERVQEALRQASAPPPTTQPADPPAPTTSKELEQRLANEQADLTNLKTRLADLDQQIKTQQERPEQARIQQAAARQLLIEIDKDLAAPNPKDEHTRLTDARRTLLATRKLARSAEINMIEQELLSQPQRLSLLKAQRDLTARKISIGDDRVKKLEAAVNELRRAEAQQAGVEAERARKEAVGKQPAVRRFAEHNAQLAKEQAQLAIDIEQAVNGRRGISNQLEKIDKQFVAAREKLDMAGLSNALGPVLREQRKSLPHMRSYRRNVDARTQMMSEYGLRYLRVEEQRRELADIPAYVEELVSQTPDTADDGFDPADLQAQALVLLQDQRTLLDKLADSYAQYLSEAASLNFEEKQLVERAGQYAEFLDEKLLWIPSTHPLDRRTLDGLRRSFAWMTDEEHWTNAAHAIWGDPLRNAHTHGLTAMACLALLVARRRLSTTINVTNGRVGTIYADNYWLTIAALAATAALAAPLPLLMGYASLRLHRSVSADDFAKALGVGLATAATISWALGSIRLLCRDKGVAQVHFNWRPEPTALLRSSLLWFLPLTAACALLVTATEWQAHDTHRQSLGRIALITGMIALAVFAHRLLSSLRRAASESNARTLKAWASHFFWLWYALLVAPPLALTALAATGYYYTAFKLAHLFIVTLCILIGLAFTHALVIRWVTVARRQLEVARARQKALDAHTASGEEPPTVPPKALVFPEVEIQAVNDHTRRLLRAVLTVVLLAALWLIWAPVLPALRVLDTVELWQQTVTVDGLDTLRPVTLTNITLAVMLAVATAVAARNVPGALELVILQRLPINPGSRYAIATTVRYIITAVGVVLVFNTVGVGWSKVQWLVAALSVGLGFGLQEIVANFVSGLIILFERPIRVGDTITVSGISGTVSRIQIRATTITDWDRKELIVPNKEFVTGQLVNWSLSDSILRVVIRVGVAYGSDTNHTRRILLDVAKKSPLVLDDPPPTAVFSEFGDSSLNFDLRVYVASIDNFVPVRHALNMAIEQGLREAKIPIPFPQRDLHMDTERPLEVHVRRAPRPKTGEASET